MRNPFKPTPVSFSIAEEDVFGRGRESRDVQQKLKEGKCTSAYVSKMVEKSGRRCCRKKVKYFLEEKAKEAAALHPGRGHYLCPNKPCHYHIGRNVTWARVAEQKIEESRPLVAKIKEAAKRRFK